MRTPYLNNIYFQLSRVILRHKMAGRAEAVQVGIQAVNKPEDMPALHDVLINFELFLFGKGRARLGNDQQGAVVRGKPDDRVEQQAVGVVKLKQAALKVEGLQFRDTPWPSVEERIKGLVASRIFLMALANLYSSNFSQNY